jgi:hypothetical protein
MEITCTRSPYCATVLSSIITFQHYAECKCVDFCSAVETSAPSMRSGATRIPLLSTTWIVMMFEKGVLDSFLKFGRAIHSGTIFIVYYGIFGIFASCFTPEELRNGIFRCMNASSESWVQYVFAGERQRYIIFILSKKSKSFAKLSQWSHIRFEIARLVASCWFLINITILALSPPIIVSTVLLYEMVAQISPPSELNDAVGAWSCWVNAALVVIAMLIVRYNSVVWDQILRPFRYLIRYIRYAHIDRPRNSASRPQIDDINIKYSLSMLFTLWVQYPFIHGWYRTRGAFWSARTTLKFFIHWWKHTQKISEMRKEEINTAWDIARAQTPENGGRPICTCITCTTKGENIQRAVYQGI